MNWPDIVYAVIVLAIALAPVGFRADLFHLALAGGLAATGAGLWMFPADPLGTCVALAPVAVYLLLLAVINLSRRPYVMSGVRDTAALAMAVAGLVMIGPAELFFPLAASIRLGTMVWVLLFSLYLLAVVMLLLTLRPRLVIYNISTDELRPVLAEVVGKLDADARWAQDSLALPNLGVQLHVDSLARLRNVSLVSSGPAQNQQGWRRLELALAVALARTVVPRNVRAIGLLSAGLIVLAFLVLVVTRDPGAVTEPLGEAIQF